MVKNYKSIIKSIVYVLAGVLFLQCAAFPMDKTDPDGLPKSGKLKRLEKAALEKPAVQKKAKNPAGSHIPKVESDTEETGDDESDADSGTGDIAAASAPPLAVESETHWPSGASQEWKDAFTRGATAWEMSVNDYLQEARDFLKRYKARHRKTRSIWELRPQPRTLGDGVASKKFIFNTGI
jgi:hypothetical protein